MSDLNELSKKIVSRREAMKKAGSAVAVAGLAFLGLGLPGVTQKKVSAGDCIYACEGGCGDETCGYNCYDQCEDGCTTCCTLDCTGDCWGSCNQTCEGMCGASCDQSCFGGCYGVAQ